MTIIARHKFRARWKKPFENAADQNIDFSPQAPFTILIARFT